MSDDQQPRRRKTDSPNGHKIGLGEAFTAFARLSGIIGGALITALAWFVVSNWGDLKNDLGEIKVSVKVVADVVGRHDGDIRVLNSRVDRNEGRLIRLEGPHERSP